MLCINGGHPGEGLRTPPLDWEGRGGQEVVGRTGPDHIPNIQQGSLGGLQSLAGDNHRGGSDKV